MSYKGFQAIAELDVEDEIFVGRLAGINDVVGFHGASVAELTVAFREAVDDYTMTCERIGKSPEKPYSGKLMLRVDPKVHAGAALAAQLAGVSLNQWSEEVLRVAAERVSA